MTNVKPLKIGKRLVGENHPAYIIFEVASTHTNNWDIAKAYVKQAKEAGADALKFQLFTADKLLNPISSVLKPTYNYFKSSETPKKWLPRLKKLCDEEGLDLLCTPFDKETASFLDSVGLPAIKIASGDLTNHQFLSHVAKFGKPVIISTGMATMKEVINAEEILKTSGCSQIAILQCTSVYPMPYAAANLKTMTTFKNKFKTVVGFSDNGSPGILAPLVATALGASIIEKHVTSQKERNNIDDSFSLSIDEFARMVKKIRNFEARFQGNTTAELALLKQEFGNDVKMLLGSSIKRPAKTGYLRADGVYMTEASERHWARRGLYPIKDIPKDTIITSDQIIALRPDVGVSAVDYGNLLDKKTSETLPAKMPIFIEGNLVRRFCKKDIKIVYRKKDEVQFVKILYQTALFD